ncbi:MAG: sulfatase-like hydrolase/transferase, partial [Akkermansiaceae bacterium]
MLYARKDAKTRRLWITLSLLFSLFTLPAFATEKPSIAFILSEDNGLYLGCYGDKNAHTPNLDQLAAEGQRYTNCFANAPVCAPARCTLLLGTYASTAGTHHMRSFYRVSPALT